MTQAVYNALRDNIAGIPVSQLAREFGGTPLFVYDAAVIKERCAQLKDFGTVRFAQKACPSQAILKLAREQGLKVDAVSAGEIMRAFAVGYKPEEIAYTCDIFDSDALELVCGDAFGCVVNVGSLDMIDQLAERLGERAKGFELTVRVNPGFGHGHGAKTNTGGPLSKHGIWHEQLGEAVARAARYGMTVTGLHMHIGSGSDFAHLAQVSDSMRRFALSVGPQIKSVSCGGGIPTPYRTGEEYFDVPRYTEVWHGAVAELEAAFGHKVELETEPGRFIVADSGFLVTKICAVKRQADNIFYLVDAGFTHLGRPMFYGSYHPISIAYAPENGTPEPGTQEVVVGGPLCESGDVFTQKEGGIVLKRELPVAKPGDYLILEVAGAYGAAMNSNYNTKFLAPEVLVENGAARLTRKKQSFEHLIANEIF
ncbi:MAG: diaminopimelate decarboxylase [Thermoguttaceae bacterium]|nr:diaminopimelate decarboxylase [Thermoguttaceae bacterium]